MTMFAEWSNSISHYLMEIERYTRWCKDNFLDYNMRKIKELLIDFMKQPPAVPPVTIDDEIVES